MLRLIYFIVLFLELMMLAGKVTASVISVDSAPSSQLKPYELVLFYSTSCNHCSQFCQTLKSYARQSRVPVIAFKLTQKASPYFPNSVLVDQKTIEQYFGRGAQIAIPALFILNPNNMYLYPVSRGNLTGDELNQRMGELMRKIKTFEGRGRG